MPAMQLCTIACLLIAVITTTRGDGSCGDRCTLSRVQFPPLSGCLCVTHHGAGCCCDGQSRLCAENGSSYPLCSSQAGRNLCPANTGGSASCSSTALPGPHSAMEMFPPRVLWKQTPLDWFRFSPDPGSPSSFRQRMLVYDKFWARPSGPMLVFWGGEGACEDFYNNSGALFELAPRLNAIIVFLEHRYYGESLPFGAESYTTPALRWLTVEQALADMSDMLARKRDLFGCDATGCDAVLFGGSYGGMASAWHRLKYPHLTAGAVASSAPVDLYPGEHKAKPFWAAVLHTFATYGSPECAAWIREGAARINATASRALLSERFRTCEAVETTLDVERVALYVKGALATQAMVDYPYPSSFVTPMPAAPVRYACAQTGSPTRTDDRLFDGLNQVMNVFLNFTGELQCHNTSAELLAGAGLGGSRSRNGASLGEISRPWNYMACSSLILEPLTSDGDGFFVESSGQIPEVVASCRERFGGIEPRLHWMEKTYGNGVQLARSLRNVLFTDGDKDPWRIGGMPTNSSDISPDGSVSRVLIRDAAHHQDLRFTDQADSPELRAARELAFHLITRWLAHARH